MSDFEVLRRLAVGAAPTEDEIDAAGALRDFEEAETGLLEASKPAHPVPDLTDDEVRVLVSAEACVKVIEFEVTSEAVYRRKYERPILPGVASGITIGIGYDLGHNRKPQVQHDLDGIASVPDIEALTAVCSLKGASARPHLEPLRQRIRVPWESAIEIYRRATVPRFGRSVLQVFPNAVEIKGHCFGALMSLIYNRGTSLEGERRREMKKIRDLMKERRWQEIPAQFRSMKRLWQDDPQAAGIVKRREAEALLFERGLELMRDAAVAAAQHERTSAPLAEHDLAVLDGDGYYHRDDDEKAETFERKAQASWDLVVWPPYDQAPDYSHIPDRSLAGTAFMFGPRELELLIEANGFLPSREHERIIFALRGAQLVQTLERPDPMHLQENRELLTLKEGMPDHKTFRCVVGIYDAARGRMYGYAASTVPNPKAVAAYVDSGKPANMMLTGCYGFTVGWHLQSKADRKIPGCLIENGRRKAILRSKKDYVFDVTDDVDPTSPGDNVHPGKSEGPFPFSSWGCIVLKGTVDPTTGGDRENLTHVGEWARFRKVLGLPDKGTVGHGRKHDLVLLTGLEAAIAADVVERSLDPACEPVRNQLWRLRQGSRGWRVAKLRRGLGMAASDIFDADVAFKLASRQQSATEKNDAIYAPESDKAFGFGVFTGPGPMASLERRSPTDATAGNRERAGERERLAFELGAQYETARGRRSTSEESDHEGLLATVGELGTKALLSTGHTLMREAELMLMGYACERGAAGQLLDRDNLRKRIDDAARTSTNALKHVLVTVLKQASFSFAPHDVLERVVGYILEEIVLPHTGPTGDAVLGRIDGGISWLCTQWSESIAIRYGVDAPNHVSPDSIPPSAHQPRTAEIPLVADRQSAPGRGEASRLLALLDTVAAGESPETSAVRQLIHQLRDHLRKTGAALSPEENKRFLDILCDSRFMEQFSVVSNRDPYVLMADVEAAIADARVDRNTIDHRVKLLCDALGDARVKLQPERIERTILALRKRRLHDHISVLTDRVLTREPDAALLGRIGPHYARSLIDNGKIIAGIEVLHATLERGQVSADMSAEIWGGLGRAHKQIYVNHVRSGSDAVALQSTLGQQLARAVDAYSKLYDPAQPDRNSWHGINLVALLKRAEEDRIATGSQHDADALTRGLIAAIEPGIASATDPYLLATLGEAYLSLGKIDLAAKYYAEFAAHPKIGAFALNSAVRQLEEVWRLEAGKDGAHALLVGLKAALSQKEGGRVILSANERRAIAAAASIPHQEHFESKVKGGRFVPLDYLKRLVRTGMAVAAIKQRSAHRSPHVPGAGETVGTGFLISGADFGLDAGRSFLLTNAHVLWDPHCGQGSENMALDPAAAEIVFEADDGESGVFTPAEIVWQSPSGLHDACLIALDRRVEKIKPLAIAPKGSELIPDDGSGRRGTRLAVVGHPEGGALSIGITGSLEEISARLLDKGPKGNSNEPTYLHYSVPTEPGNSGSPVLDASSWLVVGLHHAGYDEVHGRPKLGGKAGTHPANEGICIQSIRVGIGKNPTGSQKKPKRGWF